MIKRAYWVCNITEGWYRADLDLPETGIADYQDDIPLPLFVQKQHPGMNFESSSFSDKLVHYQYNFLGMIAIRRLIDRIGDEIYDGDLSIGVSHEGDMIKRAYWVCNITEGWYRADLDLPETGIADYQDDIPLPLFVQKQHPGMNFESSSFSDKLVHYQYNFLGMIAIRRLIDRIGDEIYDGDLSIGVRMKET